MRDWDTINSYYERLLNEFSHHNLEIGPCHGIENVSIIVNKKRRKTRKKHNVFENAQQPTIAFRLSRFSKYKKLGSTTKPLSMPELNECTRPVPPRNRNGHGKDSKQNKYKQSPFQSKFIANVLSEHRFDNCFMNLFNYPSQTKWKIYRCQVGAVEESCCCSCNSDAMFEVMKSLYDCYKAQNCDNCSCVLCSHKLQEERKLGELKKSIASIARDKVLDGKTAAEKEKILNEMAKSRLPLPAGKTASEKALINKVRKELGLPPSPKNAAEKAKMRKAEAAGIITPLEGKTPAQKEEILRAQVDLGLPLPEGRTASEKDLIDTVKAKKRHRSIVKSEFKEKGPILGAKMRKVKADGFMTPLKDKTPAHREKILRKLANQGIPLPEGKSPSENKVIDKVRTDLGLPIEPTTKAIRDKHDEAAIEGILLPLEGKTPTEKESILQGQHNMGIPLPIGRTPSEKALIARIMASPRRPSLKTAGLLTPITGKSPEQKEKILRGRAMKGLPLPEGKSASEKKLIDKVRADLGLPMEPKSKLIRDKHEQAAKAGLLQPLEGKTPAEKEKTLRGLHDLGIPLPEGRTPSEKDLIAKVAAVSRHPSRVASQFLAASEQMRRANAEGLLTPLKGKTPEQKENILRALANRGIPLPEAQTPSEKKLINKVRNDLGLPTEPKTKSIRDKHEQAAKVGLLQPLEGKTPAEKEKILKGLHDLGIPLPEGRTPSEKALLAKVNALPRAPSIKTAGLMTPLTGKPPEQKEKILRARAMKGLPLPEAQSPSEKKLIDKVRNDLGLPTEPKTKSIRDKHEQAAKVGLLQPLEGKTPAEKEKILKGLHGLGIPLPEGRSPSEKALLTKVKALPRAPSIKTAGLMTPLTGKPPEQKEKILRARAMKGLPLPEAQSPSEKKLIDKVRNDLGLPTEPKTKSIRDKHEQAAKVGLLQPLEGKTPAEKEKILKGLHNLGIPLPEGRTPSEKALLAKVKALPRAPSIKTAGLMTPLTGKPPEQKEKILRARAMKGLPLPEAQSPSEKKLIDKVRVDLGLPMEPKTKSIRDKHEQAVKAGLLQPLEGKTPAEKENILKGLHDLGILLPEGRTPSEKALIAKVAAGTRHPSRVATSFLAPSEQMRRAKAEGLLTPLKGKTPEQKEKILKALANHGIPLPGGQTPSEKKLVDKVRADFGLPKEPKTKSISDKHKRAAKAGLLQPLEGKTPAEKERILKGLHDLEIPLPEGRTPSEKALIAKVAASSLHPSRVASQFLAPWEQMRRAKAEGLLTPLKGKTPEQKEKILKALANRGIPLPEGQSTSEKKLIDKVRADLGLPTEPKTKSIRDKHEQAAKAGLLQPLEGKTPAEKEKTLQGLHELGIPLPEGRTPSEKALIAKVKAGPRALSAVLAPSEQMRRAKAQGLLTPLKDKTPEQKEKILKALAYRGIPLPEGQTPSEKKLVDKVRADLGLPKEPKTKSISDKHKQAAKAGLLQPLEGKTPAEKEKILKGLHDLGIPLPEGRTPSEKALIAKVAASSLHPSRVASQFLAPSEQMRRAKVEGLLTPLKGKTPEQKEKILKALANRGIPLPEGQTPSEKKLIVKVRTDLGLPTEPKTKSIREKHERAAKASLLQPLEGKTPAEKEKILKGLYDLGIPLPEGRTPLEKALIAKVKASPHAPSIKTAGLMSPLTGKPPEQKEKILRARAMKGLPLPEAQSPSEKKLIDKVRNDLGLPTEPKTKSIRDKHEQAAKVGLLLPLEGKTPAEKEKILKGLHELGIPLPEGRTPSEKALISKVKASPRAPPIKADSLPTVTSDKIRKAKAAGLFTPLAGKTPEHKEKILRGLTDTGLPLPKGKTPSEKELINKIIKESGIPDRTLAEKLQRAKATGLFTPLEGKSPDQKEKILRGRVAAGLPLPMYKTTSEKTLIQKIKDDTGYVTPSPSERLRKAKAAGLIIPLKDKTPSMKEKILRGMIAAGVPIPEGETPSEKKLISKLISRPPSVTQSKKLKVAKSAGLLTPLEGKTPAQKQKILEGLAKAGLSLPEGKTKSEKSMISKVKARTPPEGKTPSEKSIIGKAKAAGLFTPITGKAPAEKERIIKGLAKAGLPLPVGKTASEKELVKKIRAEAGLPIEPTPSEKKGKIRKKQKKVGVSASKRAAGLDAEEFEDIIKTTTCDRGCGCDKKKIKFKHSYVKIRVTSPDISAFCDCPGECFPGVKSGAFIDNEGIKVTVGSAVGIPSYSMECINQAMLDEIVSNIDLSKTRTHYHNYLDDSKKPKYKVSSELGLNNSNKMNYVLNASSSDMRFCTRPYRIKSENIHAPSSIAQYQGRASKSDMIVESSRGLQSSDDVYKGPTSKPNSTSSYETIVIIKNDMSLSTSTSDSNDSISLISVIDSTISSSSAHYSGYQSTYDLLSINSLDGPITSDDSLDYPAIVWDHNVRAAAPHQYTIFRMTQLEANFGNKKMRKSKENSETEDPIVLFNQLPSKLDVSKIMFKIMSKKRFTGASSIFIVVPMSDDDEEQASSNCVDSITSIPSSECHFTASTICPVNSDPLRTFSFTKRDEQVCGKGKKFYMQEISSSNDTETIFQNEPLDVLRLIGMTEDEFCQTSTPNEKAQKMLEKAIPGVGTDTTTDRACSSHKDHYAANVISREITPVFWKGSSFSWFHLPGICKSSTACDIPPCFDPSFNPVPLNHPRYHGRSQQSQITKYPSLCVCPPDDFEEERNRSAKVQKPSIQSMRYEGDNARKKAGWFRSHKATSSAPVCDIPPCSNLSSSPVPSNHRHQHGHSQQHQTPESPRPCVCPSDDYNIYICKSFSWYRKSSACDTPPCFDPSSSPEPPNRPHHHGRSQQNQITKSPSLCGCPPDDFKEERNRSAKFQKPSIESMRHEGDTTPRKAGWFRSHKAALSAPVCDIPPCSDFNSSPMPSNHSRRQHGRSQEHHTTESSWPCVCPPDDYDETRSPSAKSAVPKKVGKSFSWFRKSSAYDTPQTDPSFSPEPLNHLRYHGRSQQNQITRSPSLCSCPPDDFKEERNRSAKVQKPSVESMRHEGDTAPKKAGKSFSWFRKTSACYTPLCFDPSFSPEPNRPRQNGRSQQNQITISTSLCGCPPDDFKEERNRSAKVQKPSIESMRPEGSSWFRLPTLRKVPPCFDPSPVPPNRPRHHGRSQQHQTPDSSCVCPPDDYEEWRNPSAKVQKPSTESIRRRGRAPKKAGLSLSWSRLPSKRNGCAACDTPPYFDSSSSPVPTNHPRHHGRSQQNQTTASLCGCPLDDLKETRNPSAKVQKPSIESILHEGGTAPKKAGKGLGWSRLCKGKASVACDISPCLDPSFSPVPSKRPRQHRHSQKSRVLESLPSCVCTPDDYEETRNLSPKEQKSSSIELMRAAAKKAGACWRRLPFLLKGSAATYDTPPCFDPSPVPPNRPRHHGRSQQHQTPESFCVCPPDDYEETRNPSAKVQKASIESIRRRGTASKKAGTSWFPLPTLRKGSAAACGTPHCFDRSSSPVPPQYPRHHGRSQQTQIPASLSGYPSGDLKETRNPSAKVQKPSIESIRHEGRTASKKPGVGSGWFRLPCMREAPAKDPKIPEDLESPKTSKLKESKIFCGCQKDKPITLQELEIPKDPKSPETSKLKDGMISCGCKEDSPINKELESPKDTKSPKTSILKERTIICPCDKDKPMSSKDLESSKDPIGQQPTKLAEEITPVPLTLVTSNTSKEDKPMSPKELESRKDLVSQSKLFPSIKKSISKINETLKSQVGQRAPSKPKDPSSPKDQKSPETSKLKDEMILCGCKEDTPMIPKELESAKDPNSPEPCNLYEEKMLYGCEKDKPISPKQIESPKTSKLKEKKIICGCKEDKLMSAKHLESPKTSKLKMDKIICACDEDKPMNAKDLEIPKTSKLKKDKIICTCDQDKPMRPKGLESPKTSKQKEGIILCACDEEKLKLRRGIICPCQEHSPMQQPEPAKSIFRLSDPIDQQPTLAEQITPVPQTLATSKTGKEDKPMSLEDLENPKDLVGRSKLFTSIKKSISKINLTLKSQVGQQAPSNPKDLSGPKDLKSPETSKQKEEELVCVCNEDKPMNPKDLKSPKTSKQEGKLVFACKEDTPKSPKDVESSKPSTQKQGETACESKEDKPMSPKHLESAKDQNSPKTSKQKDGIITYDCKEDKPISPKELESPKDLKSPITGKQKGGGLLWECEEDKMEKQKKDTETKPGGQSTPRQKRCPPRLPPVILGLPPVETPEGYLYEGIGPSCKWLDTGEIKKLRSELTQSTSGFKACKRKKQVHVGKVQVALPEDNIELDFGEAIRYFATMNPECFQRLMQEELESQRDAEEIKLKEPNKFKTEKREMEKARKKAEKEAKKGILNKTRTTNEDNTPIFYETTEFSDETETMFPQGFKFSTVKDGPTGLAGVDCTEMNRELFMVKRHK